MTHTAMYQGIKRLVFSQTLDYGVCCGEETWEIKQNGSLSLIRTGWLDVKINVTKFKWRLGFDVWCGKIIRPNKPYGQSMRAGRRET